MNNKRSVSIWSRYIGLTEELVEKGFDVTVYELDSTMEVWQNQMKGTVPRTFFERIWVFIIMHLIF